MTTVNLRNGMVVTEASMADDGHEIYFLPVAEECVLSAADAVAAAASAQASLNSLVSASGANATSTTTLTIGLGSRSLTIQTGKNFAVGHTLKIASTASPGNYMIGDVVSYNSGTGALVVDVSFINGTGSASAWTVTIFSGAASGGGGRNYVFNGDGRIQQNEFAAGLTSTRQHHSKDGFLVWAESASGSAGTVFSTPSGTVGIIGQPGATILKPNISQRIASNDAVHLSGKAITVSCDVFFQSPLTLTVSAIAPTAIDNYSSTTTLASEFGQVVVSANVWTRLVATLPAGLTFTNGIEFIFSTIGTIDLAGSRVFRINNIKAGFDSNFEPNDADIIKALTRYERSYPDASFNAANSLTGAKRAQILTGGVNLIDATVVYKQKKRALPTVTIFSPSNGATANVAEYTTAGVFVANRAATVTDSTVHGFNLTITGGTAGNVAVFHWVADSRL
jgi:hypothetical protein